MHTELGTVEKSLKIHWKGRCYLSIEEHQNAHLSLEFKRKI